MSRLNSYGLLLLVQIIWFTVMTAANNYIFGISNYTMQYGYYQRTGIYGFKKIPGLYGARNASVLSMLLILLPAVFNIAVLSYWFIKNDDKINEYIENTVSKTMYIGYFPLVVTGFLAKGLIF